MCLERLVERVDGCDMMENEALIAQWIEHRSSKPVVAGSNPAGRANPLKRLQKPKETPKYHHKKQYFRAFFCNYSGALFWLLTASGRSQALGCGVWIWQPEAAKSILHTKEASHRRW